MWANFLRFVDQDGTPLRDLQEQARLTNLAGLQRWRYVVVEPDPADPRPAPPRRDWVVRPTPAGRQAQGVWSPLPGLIEERWHDRFGAAEVGEARGRAARCRRPPGRRAAALPAGGRRLASGPRPLAACPPRCRHPGASGPAGPCARAQGRGCCAPGQRPGHWRPRPGCRRLGPPAARWRRRGRTAGGPGEVRRVVGAHRPDHLRHGPVSRGQRPGQ
jgi:hypothetical protein